MTYWTVTWRLSLVRFETELNRRFLQGEEDEGEEEEEEEEEEDEKEEEEEEEKDEEEDEITEDFWSKVYLPAVT